MPEFESIPFEFDELPISKTVSLGNADYLFEFHFNSFGNFFTMIAKDPFDQIIFSTKLVYGVNANHFIVDGFPFDITLIPADLNDIYSEEIKEYTFTKDTIGSIKLYLGKVNE